MRALLVESNYELRFTQPRGERARYFPGFTESDGIEDTRFVRFVDDDGTALYYATHTAYNGRVILTQLMKTRDFLDFMYSL